MAPEAGVSVVVPMRDEDGNVAPLLAEIAEVAAAWPHREVIAVDDGSADRTLAALHAARGEHPELRILHHPRPAGQSAAIHSAVRAARFTVICMLDGDGQNPPGELPRLVAPLLAAGSGRLGLVAGQRARRADTPARRLASRLANRLRAGLLHDGTRDTGCGLKAFRREAFLALPYFDHMHRYLPALFRRDGWEVVLIDVGDRPRRSGRSKYGNFGRALVGIQDLLGVAWLIRRRKKAEATEETDG